MKTVAYPFRLDEMGLPSHSSDNDMVHEMLALLFETERGEIEGMADFGASVGQFVFANRTPGLASLVFAEMSSVAERWIPFVTLANATAREDSDSTYLEVVSMWNLNGDQGEFTEVIPLVIGGA